MTLTIDITPEMQTRLERAATRLKKRPSDIVMEALHLCLPAADYEPPLIETKWEALTQLIAECQMDTGITDLAHQHDHYLYGTPKREPYPPDTESQDTP